MKTSEKFKKIRAMLKLLNIPTAYLKFKNTTSPPFAVFVRTTDNKIVADDSRFYSDDDFIIELYYVDLEEGLNLEEKLEHILDENGIIYDKSESFIEKEELYLMMYLFKY